MPLPARSHSERLARSREQTVVRRKFTPQRKPSSVSVAYFASLQEQTQDDDEDQSNEFAPSCVATVLASAAPDPAGKTVSLRRGKSPAPEAGPVVTAPGAVFQGLLEGKRADVIDLPVATVVANDDTERDAAEDSAPGPEAEEGEADQLRAPPRLPLLELGQCEATEPASHPLRGHGRGQLDLRSCVECGQPLASWSNHLVVGSRAWCLRCSRSSWSAINSVLFSRARLRLLLAFILGLVVAAALFTPISALPRGLVAMVAVPLLGWLAYQRGRQVGAEQR